MCGIAGILGFHRQDLNGIETITKKMAKSIHHRGPDDNGIWIDSQNEIALVHNRLSIIDLTNAGHQPMSSHSNRFIIIFNGEIYNFFDLKSELEKSSKFGGTNFNWRGNSDTEILLASIEKWGIEIALSKTIGMFAFALWDKKDKKLILARDRMGEKPLYYGWHDGAFLFGSELKAFRAHPAFKREINRDAITLYLRHNYIPAPYTIYNKTFKLMPASYIEIDLISRQKNQSPKLYWSLDKIISEKIANPFLGDDFEATLALDQLLKKTVQRQMISDVPVGAFLSGGIDSSLIVSVMQSISNNPIKTFSVGFLEAEYNEANFAKSVANHLNTDHTEIYITPKETFNVLPEIPTLYDEPFSDLSQIPNFLISKLAKEKVKVSLSGDGGDELFGGYTRYKTISNLWKKLSYIPMPLRNFMSNGLYLFNSMISNNHTSFAESYLPIKVKDFLNKLQKAQGLLCQNNRNIFYRDFVSHLNNPELFVVEGTEPHTVLTSKTFEHDEIYDQMMALDMLTYLPDDILVKVDRAAMGVSLETRIPFLDHNIIEFAWSLPLSKKIRDGKGKWILRNLLNNYLPKNLTDRPKMGLGMPLDIWLRGPLSDWVESLLDEKKLNEEGFFNSYLIRQKWEEHKNNKKNWQYHLWDILMFQAWLEEECLN